MAFFARLFVPARDPATAVISADYSAGVVALQRGHYDEASAYFNAAVSAARTPAELAAAHNKRAVVYLYAGDREAAVGALCEALLADSRYVPAIVNIGNVLLETDALDDAIVHYEAALRLDDGDPAAHLNLGIAFKRVGRHADAVREFRRADRLDARIAARRR